EQPPSSSGRATPSARTTVSSAMTPSAIVAIRTDVASSPGSTQIIDAAAVDESTARQHPYHAFQSSASMAEAAACTGMTASAAAIGINTRVVMALSPYQRSASPTPT